MIDGFIEAFHAVKVYSQNYALHEYGATPEELDDFVQKANQELDEDRGACRLKRFTGKLNRV
jgi:hypothetical protein